MNEQTPLLSAVRGATAPLFVVYILIALVVAAFIRLAQMEDVTFGVDLISAAPLAFSAIILGAFSVLFWSLNYISRNHRSTLRIQEARALFEARREAIENVMSPFGSSLSDKEKALLSAHILFSNEELPSNPEIPNTGFSLSYPELMSTILRKG